MSRTLLTCVVCVVLWGGYRLYTRIMEPLTRRAGSLPTASLQPLPAATQSRELAVADSALADVDWTNTAQFKVKHSESTYIYFDRYETDGNRVDLAPFALVIHDVVHRRRRPLVFVCDSARVMFEREFKIGGPSPGRLVAGALDGQVRITGPFGLDVQGRQFVFSEDSQQIYTDAPVTFRYAPNRNSVRLIEGSADAAQVDLTPATYAALGEDMPRVSGLERFTLRKNVQMRFQYLIDGERRITTVTSDGRFVYDFTRDLATFQNNVAVIRPTRGKGQNARTDRLRCESLALQFGRTGKSIGQSSAVTAPADATAESAAEGEPDSPLGQLQLHSLQALAGTTRPVTLESDDSRLTARMQNLWYDAIDRTLVLVDQENSVELIRDGVTLRAPGLRLMHDADGEVTFTECVQSGRLDFERPENDSSGLQRFHAVWDDRLQVLPNPETGETAIILEGNARVIQPGEQGILCDRLTLWIDSTQWEQLQASETDTAAPGRRAPASPITGPSANAAPASLPIRRLLAEGNVALAGRQFQVETARLEASFQSGRLAAQADWRRGAPRETTMRLQPTAPGNNALARRDLVPLRLATQYATEPAAAGRLMATRFASGSRNQPGSPRHRLPSERVELWIAQPREQASPRASRHNARHGDDVPLRLTSLTTPTEPIAPPYVVQAKTIRAVLLQDGETQQVDVAELHAEGNVEIVRDALDDAARPAGNTGGESLAVTGERLSLFNQGGTDQRLELHGGPAHLWHGDVHIEGADLVFDRGANTARVIGKGLMQLPVNRSPTGDELAAPEHLDIHWAREMTFNGARADFIERVHCRLADSVMRCDEMQVNLNRRLDFSASRPETEGLSIATIQCQRGVEVEYYQWAGEEPIAVAKGYVAEFQIDYEQGNYEARGPGDIEAWQKGEESRVEVDSKAVARANQPTASESLPWQYTHLHFVGRLAGNFKASRGTLYDRVTVLYAPVGRIRERFARDDLSKPSESARQAVFVGCDELQISLQPWESREDSFLQLLAVGKLAPVELEGHVFQATSDTLSYDESKNLITLRGLGTNKASLYYQERQGAEYRDVPAQRIEFNPADRSVKVEGSAGAF